MLSALSLERLGFYSAVLTRFALRLQGANHWKPEWVAPEMEWRGCGSGIWALFTLFFRIIHHVGGIEWDKHLLGRRSVCDNISRKKPYKGVALCLRFLDVAQRVKSFVKVIVVETF